MSATTLSDKFLNAVARWSGQVGAAGVSSTSATTIPLQSSTGLVNGRVYWFTLNRLTGTTKNAVSNTEGFPGIINTATHEITTTAPHRGSEGTATAWPAGTLVEILHSAGYMNRFIEGLEVSLNQDGSVKPAVVDGTKVYAADAGSTDAYAITLSPAPTAYATGQTFRFKANTVNTGAATLNVNGLGAKTIVKNYNSTLADGDILANQLVEVIYDGTNFQLLSPISNVSSGIITTSKYAPQGFLINGKIVPSVASNNLTVALKGMDGNDPSASNPVYVRTGETVRTITAALSVTKNAGTNWCNSGSAGLATKEIDYFVYLGYNATDGVVIGFSRIPYATIYSDFSATSTNEKYAGISTITNAAAGDTYENIGRFAATLSAGAGYTWTVPTYTPANLIQRPIYETRWLNSTPTWDVTTYDNGSGGQPTTTESRYRISGNQCTVHYRGTGVKAGTNYYILCTSFSFMTPANYTSASVNGVGMVQTTSNLVGVVEQSFAWENLTNIPDNTTINLFSFTVTYEI